MFDFTKKEGSAALAFLVAGSAWFVVGTIYGFLSALTLVAPEIFNNLPGLVFSRMRPIHVNTVLFGFVTTTLMGAGLHYTPALLKTRLRSERLAWVGFLFWNAAILSGPLTFSFGISQGREYAEYIWIFDVCIMIALVLMAIDLVMTISIRKEKTLYVSVWYFTMTFFWTIGFYPIGNVMWHPSTGSLPGLLDSLLLWSYGHNLPGLLLTPLSLGAAYFVLPRVTRAPIYSHTLSLYAFWTLVALYSHIGGHHILQAPIPNWLKVMSVVDSFIMVIPVFAVLFNLWLSARGHGGPLLADPAGRFIIAGTVFYLLTCIQGPVQSLPSVQRITHFTNWTIGHSHLAVLGFVGFMATGALWHVLPLITGRRLYSPALVNLQFSLMTFGVVGFLIVLTIAGLIQGHSWESGTAVVRVLPELAPYMAMRAAIGVSVLAASFVGLYNLVMTMTKGEPAGAPERLSPLRGITE
jgi:cbb3-type cytochrome c oxidase subunit I